MFRALKRLFSRKEREAQLQQELERLRQRTPVPVFWLFGKTQSGKSSIVRFLTGADDAEIGQGFRPCTRFSREYRFPTPEAPLLTFLDTRGLDEPGYDPAEDLARFDPTTHVVIVTVKAMDHALENLVGHLRTIRRAQPSRPIVLALTCLHEAYPQAQHPPYPFADGIPVPTTAVAGLADDLLRSLREQRQRFEGLVDRLVPIDLTRPEEGYHEPNYGGDHFKQVLLELLPAGYRQTLVALDEASQSLQDLYARQALTHIVGYATLAATAGAIPIPFLDLLILPGIQTRMIFHLAEQYGQPLDARRFLELAGTLGLGMLTRQAVRSLAKFIPYVGSVVGAAFAGASTFALGKAFCFYYSAIHKGHVPRADDLKRYYEEQLALAERSWSRIRPKNDGAPMSNAERMTKTQ